MRSTRRPRSTTPRTQKGIVLHRGPSMYWVPDSTPPPPPLPPPVIANDDSFEPASRAMTTDAIAQALDPKPEPPIPDPGAELPPADPDAAILQAAEAEFPIEDPEPSADSAASEVVASLATPQAIRDPAISLSHHQRKCRICKDPQLDDIEQDFLDWWSAQSIVNGYGLGHVSALYRHAHATGLFVRRRAVRIFALEHIIEKVSEVDVTALSIVMAMRVLNDMLEKSTSRARRTRPSQLHPAIPNRAKQTATPLQPNFRITP